MASPRPATGQLRYNAASCGRFLPLLLAAAAAQGAIRFRAQEISAISAWFTRCWQPISTATARPDVVAINPTQVVWFENPTWEKHVILDGATKKDNVCMAAADIDGDGKPDLALGADWHPSNTTSGGTLQWIGRDITMPAAAAAPSAPWKLVAIAEEPDPAPHSAGEMWMAMASRS